MDESKNGQNQGNKTTSTKESFGHRIVSGAKNAGRFVWRAAKKVAPYAVVGAAVGFGAWAESKRPIYVHVVDQENPAPDPVPEVAPIEEPIVPEEFPVE